MRPRDSLFWPAGAGSPHQLLFLIVISCAFLSPLCVLLSPDPASAQGKVLYFWGVAVLLQTWLSVFPSSPAGILSAFLSSVLCLSGTFLFLFGGGVQQGI